MDTPGKLTRRQMILGALGAAVATLFPWGKAKAVPSVPTADELFAAFRTAKKYTVLKLGERVARGKYRATAYDDKGRGEPRQALFCNLREAGVDGTDPCGYEFVIGQLWGYRRDVPIYYGDVPRTFSCG